MKKKIIAIAIVVSLVCVVGIVLVINSTSKASKDDKQTVNKGSKWSAEEYVDAKDKDSAIDKTAVEVDTDPTSITVLVNKEYKVPSDYEPEDLVEPNVAFSFNYKDEKRMLREEAAKQLELLFKGAKRFGYELLGVSGYRSYERQKTLYEFNLMKYGYEYTQKYSAMPGTSEHQTGLAIDISCKSMGGILRTTFADTKEGKWVQNNAYKYGYVVRYANNKTDLTGYAYEPWHIRYVGYDLAKYLHDNNMTLDEYYAYKLNIDIIDREQYAYYDDLLSRNKKGDIVYSKAVLDDLLDKKDVMEDEKPEEPQPLKDPDDILDGLGESDGMDEDIGDGEDDGMPDVTSAPTTEPTKEATIKPTSGGTPTSGPVGGQTSNPVEPSQPPVDVPSRPGGDSSDKDEDEDKKDTYKPGFGFGRP